MKCTSSAKSRMDANMQLTINSFRPLFPHKIFSCQFHDISLTFCKIPDISLTAANFPDISRFSRQVVTLLIFTCYCYSDRSQPWSAQYLGVCGRLSWKHQYTAWLRLSLEDKLEHSSPSLSLEKKRKFIGIYMRWHNSECITSSVSNA